MRHRRQSYSFILKISRLHLSLVWKLSLNVVLVIAVSMPDLRKW